MISYGNPPGESLAINGEIPLGVLENFKLDVPYVYTNIYINICILKPTLNVHFRIKLIWHEDIC